MSKFQIRYFNPFFSKTIFKQTIYNVFTSIFTIITFRLFNVNIYPWHGTIIKKWNDSMSYIRWSSPTHFYHHQRMLIQSNNNLKKKTFNNVPIYICWNLNELASKRINGYNACQIPRTRLLKRQILLEKNLRFGYVHQYINTMCNLFLLFSKTEKKFNYIW